LEAMKAWPAVSFTHRGGALRLRWWVEGVRRAGFIPVVCDDAADPLPGWARGWLHAQGVEYRVTDFPRRGNLNGTDCAAAIAAELAAACERHEASHALKVDDDTVIVRPELFTAHAAAGAIGLTWEEGPRAGAYGMAYGLEKEAARAASRILTGGPFDPHAPEDLAVWSTVKKIAPVVEHRFRPDEGPFTALPAGACVTDAVRRFGVITVGNPPPGGWRDRDRETAGRMREMVKVNVGRRTLR